ncbi:MAG: response regulator [Anaerolineales bacterium]|nr:response regulator [Anaerolineales bacterium]TET83888.1 MAG: response regulator transcription factor [Anaerolineales bacterium]
MAVEVLLIDDDPDLSIMLRTLLRGQDFQIQAVFSGEEGIQACRGSQPDVVILDILMPEMDGWEVCEQIRDFSEVPILILSALGSPGSVARALDAGADDYLIKPIHASLLASRLRTLVRRSLLVHEEQVA